MIEFQIDEIHDLFFDIDGREYVVESSAIAILLEFEIVFPHFHDRMMSLAVNCSDVFAWASADAESIESEMELISLTKEVIKDRIWGSVKWVAKKRNHQPQQPIINSMKCQNVWDDEMEALPLNRYGE